MNAVVLLFLPVVLAASPSHRIVNGMDVDIRDYPWQGSYRDATNAHACGCTYVGGTWTLTSAHCGGSSSYGVGYGHTDRTRLAVFPIAYVLSHPFFESGPGYAPNNYALVRTYDVPQMPNDTSVIQPAMVANNPENPGGSGAISGWGRTCESCDNAVNLQGVRPMPIISDTDCEAVWGTNFQSDSMICVWNNAQGTCYGDAGSPLIVNSTVVGLASWSSSNCSPQQPSVYAKVGAVYSWICDSSLNEVNGC